MFRCASITTSWLLTAAICAGAAAQEAKPWLGVYLADVEHAEVAEVVPGSPAAAAGLLVGDVILRVGDRAVGSAEALIAALAERAVGERVELAIARGGAERVVAARLGDRPQIAAVPRPMVPIPSTGGAPPAAPGGAGPAVDEFEAARARAIARGVPLVVAFWAPWCGHSKALRAAFEDPELAAISEGVELLWLDADVEDRRADSLGVVTIPCLIAFDRAGARLAEQVGYQPPSVLVRFFRGLHGESDGVAPAVTVRPDGGGDVDGLRRTLTALQLEVEQLRTELRALREEVRRLRDSRR